MEITTYIAVAFMVFFIGFAVGRTGRRNEENLFIKPNSLEHYELSNLKRELDYERTVGCSLREQIKYINYNCRYRHEFGSCCNCRCEKKFYAQTVDQQKLVDVIVKSQKSAEQLAKDLDLELPK